MSKRDKPQCLLLMLSGLLLVGSRLNAAAQEPKPATPPPGAAEDANKPAPAAPVDPSQNPAPADPANPPVPATPPALPQQPGGPPEVPTLNPPVPDFSGPVPGQGPMPGTPAVVGPPLQRVYRVGKFVIKYGTDVRARNPKLPTEEQLAAATVALVEVRGTLYHPAKKPAAVAKPATGGLFATTSAEQNERVEKADVDLALHPPSDTPTEPEKPADKPGPKPDSKPDKNIPKAIPKPAPREDKVTTLKVSAFGEPRFISAMALLDVYDGIVKQLTDRGLIGIYVLTGIEPRSGIDLRTETLDVEVQIFVSEVAKIRTIARRIPFRLGDLPKINDEDAPDGVAVKDPKHLWIKEKSPVFVFNQKKGGGLLEKQRLQDYLSRLNRFPGRRVDAAINATGETGKVMLDYLIREQKPFMIYFQESNTGVKSTGEWRSRLGIEYRQLANKDDILRLEYVTSDFRQFNSAIAAYQFALDKPDVLKMRVYGLYGNYSAEDVGFAGANFSGESITAGAAITWTPLYWRGFPLDLTLGAEFLRVSVNNEASGIASAGNFILPYVAIGTERVTDRFSLAANFQFKGSFDGPDQDTLNGLGRFDTDGEFLMLNGDFSASIFLEPLIFGKKWGEVGKNGEKWWRGMLANEIVLQARGQYALGDARLVPQLEMIVGGLNTVRGYPESLAAGDTGMSGTLEYRLHVPRLFKPSDAVKSQKEAKAAADSAKKGKPPGSQNSGVAAAGPPHPAPVQTALPERGGRTDPFRIRPGTAGTTADWDLIVRLFTDFGQTYNSRRQDVIEVDRSLFSVGAGLELQIFKPLFMTIRADYGIVLQSQSDLLVNPVENGDSRLHISATIAW